MHPRAILRGKVSSSMEALTQTAEQLDRRVLSTSGLERLRRQRRKVALAAGNALVAMAGFQVLAINEHHTPHAVVCIDDCAVPTILPLPTHHKHHVHKPPKPTLKHHHAAPKPTAAPKLPAPLTHAKKSPQKSSQHPKVNLVEDLTAHIKTVEQKVLDQHLLAKLLPRLLGEQEFGYDVGRPQCERSLPAHADYAILSLFMGYPGHFDTNCVARFMSWAQTATPQHGKYGGYYINVSDPGPKGNLWPTNNLDPAGHAVKMPDGICAGDNSLACSEQYGYNMAWRADHLAFRPAAAQIGDQLSLAHHVVFMDVEGEGEGAWETGAQGREHNQAAVLGNALYLRSVGAIPGLYGSHDVVPALIGQVATDSPLHGLPEWHAQGYGQHGAEAVCASSWFDDGPTWLGQFVRHGIDVNVNCGSLE
ncbi:MAG TPA: hypothetical protein VG992_00970 [Candidatus Saccharimonadales bacterium]|nr:hypothetical protein [Candidatus Saccharimonadales bacterium]